MSRSPADTNAPLTRSTACSSGSELSHCCSATLGMGARERVRTGDGSHGDRVNLAMLSSSTLSQICTHNLHPVCPALSARSHLRGQYQRRGRLELVVQHRLHQLLAAALHAVPDALVGADGVVRVDRAAACECIGRESGVYGERRRPLGTPKTTETASALASASAPHPL